LFTAEARPNKASIILSSIFIAFTKAAIAGRGGPIGYRLVFRDGGKVYMEHSVADSIALVKR
jgi:hypothetical protein